MSKEIAPTTGKLIHRSKAPAELARIINIENWAQAIVNGVPYDEPDPDFISRSIAFQLITAETIEDVFRQQKILKLQEILADEPGATTGPRIITDLYVAKSDFETGNPTFVIITWTDMELGTESKVTTGATNVQATLLALINMGQYPIKCQIKRGESKDKGGRYLLHVLPPD